MSKLKLSSYYLLAGIKKDGSRVFYDIDSHSGGWPYWSSGDGRKFSSLAQVPTIDQKDYMRNEVTSIQVLKVDVAASVVSTTELVSEVKAKAMAEIDKLQKDLARKVAALEGMK